MNEKRLRQVLDDFKSDRISLEAILEKLSTLPYEDLGFAKLDHHRNLRRGAPEVVFGPGKSREQILDLLKALHRQHGRALATRVQPEIAGWILDSLSTPAVYHERAQAVSVGPFPNEGFGFVVVACAGTSDLPVAEEAALTLSWLGSKVELMPDLGVAGLHRLLSQIEGLREAHSIVAVAGMDGAMPSVLGSLVTCPVFAVPTSVGYGTNLQGLAPLLAMLNSCVPGVSVVNVDNGFGAAYSAHLVNKGAST